MFKLIKNIYRPPNQTGEWKICFPLWFMKDKTPHPYDDLYIIGQSKTTIPPQYQHIFDKGKELAEPLPVYLGFDRRWVSETHLQIIYYVDTLETCIAYMNRLKMQAKQDTAIRNWELVFPNGDVKYYS